MKKEAYCLKKKQEIYDSSQDYVPSSTEIPTKPKNGQCSMPCHYRVETMFGDTFVLAAVTADFMKHWLLSVDEEVVNLKLL